MTNKLVNKIGNVKFRYSRYKYGQYYGDIIFNMANKIEKLKEEKSYNTNTTSYLNKPGISFSFDDSFRVSQWYKYGKELFGYYDVRATFNINAYHHFEGQREHSQNEIDMLLELQANGHEIAHHGYKHQSAVHYSKENGSSKWVEDEIIPLFHWMENQSHSKTKEKFKKPVTYAFPYTHYNEENIKELVPNFFKLVRGHSPEHALMPFNYSGLASSINIDSRSLTDVKYIKRILRLAKETGNNLIFMCHSLLPDEIDWNDFKWGEEAFAAGEWRISPKMIFHIIEEAKKLDLEFYTTAEIAGVATFIDTNLEKCVRQKLTNPNERWISISELSKINELDLNGKNISNLDGMQYFIGLEKLNLLNNNVADFRILKKLKNLKDLKLQKYSSGEKNSIVIV